MQIYDCGCVVGSWWMDNHWEKERKREKLCNASKYDVGVCEYEAEWGRGAGPHKSTDLSREHKKAQVSPAPTQRLFNIDLT